MKLQVITESETDHQNNHHPGETTRDSESETETDHQRTRRPGRRHRPMTLTSALSPASADQCSTQSTLQTPRRNCRSQTPRICCCPSRELAPAPDIHTPKALSILGHPIFYFQTPQRVWVQ